MTLLVVGLLFGFPPVALAHTGLEVADPAPGETVDASVRQVELTFDSDIRNLSVTLIDPDGEPVPGTLETVDSRTSRLAIAGLNGAGQYIVRYDVLSGDGDLVSSSFAFWYSGATGSSYAGLYLGAVAMFLVVGGVVIAVTLRRGGRQ